MADDAARYLGFAFASADLLFELDGEGVVTFAIGAARQVAGVELEALAGATLRDIVADEDQSTVEAFLGSLDAGDRRGPIRIALRPKPGRKLRRYAALCACRLPQMAPRISCSLTLRVMGSVAAEAKGPNGLHSAESFAAVAENALKDYIGTQHLIGTQLAEVNGDEGALESYLNAWHKNPDNSVYYFLGTYLSKVRRTANGWQIYDMTLRLDTSGIVQTT